VQGFGEATWGKFSLWIFRSVIPVVYLRNK